jgi:hypothetical protein
VCDDDDEAGPAVKDRVARMLSLLENPDPTAALRDLCATALVELEVTGVAVIAVVTGEPLGVLAADGEGVPDLERLLTGGDGPSASVRHDDHSLSVPDLADARVLPFSEAALELGTLAVFAFPLRVGGARVGALVLGRDRAGPLRPDQAVDAIVLADVAALLVLSVQARATVNEVPADGTLAALTDGRMVVHQAAGMVSVQLDVGIAEAHVALRARAWVLGQSVAAVGRDVVARRLRFTDDGVEQS